MTSVLRLLLLLCCCLAATARAGEPLTVILVRHAEKAVVPPENKDPELSAAGKARAQELARTAGGAGVGAIFASHLQRTQLTVQPLAEQLKLKPVVVPAQQTAELVAQLRQCRGVALVAGHNNTVPEIIAALGGPKLAVIPETEYDNFFVLSLAADGSAQLVRLKYGEASAAK